MSVGRFGAAWVCEQCGERAYGAMAPGHVGTWHVGTCDICLCEVPVTEPRDFGARRPWSDNWPDRIYDAVADSVEWQRGKPVDNQTDGIPLKVQTWMFDCTAKTMLDDVLPAVLSDEHLEILRLAKERLCGGFDSYGDAMYHRTPGERRREVLEEIADAIVYLTSGSVNDEREP